MEFGDYEEDLPTAILGGADESWNVDHKRDLHCTSHREWLAGFRSTCDDMRTGACSSGSVPPSTYKLFEGRGVWLEIGRAFRSAHFIGLQSTSDRTEPEEDSPVHSTKAYKFRVCRFPWRQRSLFPSKHSGPAIAIRENTFLPADVRRIYTPPAPLAGRGGALKLVRGDAAFLIMS